MSESTPDISLISFKQQIREDIGLIREKVPWDPKINKVEYTFNYWVLSHIYKLDEESCQDNITEYNDKGIDCFVHYEEDKELYIIQNKYYGENNRVKPQELADFLQRPIALLEQGKYKRSKQLQEIYTKAKADKSYKIFLHFYVTNDIKITDATDIIKNRADVDSVFVGLFYLKDIYEKYYGKPFQQKHKLKAKFRYTSNSSLLAIKPEKKVSKPLKMLEAYYLMARVSDIHTLWSKANKDNYPLFEENIREYLGGGGINKAIINTLESAKERYKFFYYNNGITIICDSAEAKKQGGKKGKISIDNPQIVNGCQTVNSITEVLKNKDIKDFEDVYVMVKILVVKDKNKNKDFYRDIVKYTNSQNAINEKAFGAMQEVFLKIQEQVKARGFLVIVKQSDKYKFRVEYKKNKKSLEELLDTAKKNLPQGYSGLYSKVTDLQINLETLIQIIGAFEKDAYFAYTKRSSLLKPNSTAYKEFSTKIKDIFTAESMVKLILLYKQAEYDKKNSEDKKSPSPYYLLNFLGYYLKEIQSIDKQAFLQRISIEKLLTIVYRYFKPLSSMYYEACKQQGYEYNQISKRITDKKIMEDKIKSHFSYIEAAEPDAYNKFTDCFKKT